MSKSCQIKCTKIKHTTSGGKNIMQHSLSRASAQTLIKSKKGVSPLIATVLLIAFAVALGAVVMNWGSEYVRSQATSTGQKSDVKIKCAQDVDLSVVNVDDIPKLCYNNETSYERIEFLLTNDGNVQVESLKVTVVSNTSAVVSGILNITIPVGDTVFLNVSYAESTNGQAKRIAFLPQIKVAGLITPVWCPKNALEKTEIPVCES